MPTYYFSLAFTVCVMALACRSIEAKTVVGNIFFLQDMQGDIVSPLSFNSPLWSLSYEVFYYLLFALIMRKPVLVKAALLGSLLLGVSTYIVPAGSGVMAFTIRLGSLFCVWLLGSVAVQLLQRGMAVSVKDAGFLVGVGFCLSRVWLSKDFYDFFRLFMFGIGCAALCSALLGEESVSTRTGSVITKTIPIFIRGTLAIVVGATLWFASRSVISTKVALLTGLIGLTLAPGLVILVLKRAIKTIAPLLSAVGKLSYALYLVHYPVIQLVNYCCCRIGTVGRMSVAAAASISLAYWLDLVVQKRIKRRVLGQAIVSL